MLKRVTTLALAILGNFVDADLVVPAGDCEEIGSVGGWRKDEIRDAVGRRIIQRDVLLQVAHRGRRRGARRCGAEQGHDVGCLDQASARLLISIAESVSSFSAVFLHSTPWRVTARGSPSRGFLRLLPRP